MAENLNKNKKNDDKEKNSIVAAVVFIVLSISAIFVGVAIVVSQKTAMSPEDIERVAMVTPTDIVVSTEPTAIVVPTATEVPTATSTPVPTATTIPVVTVKLEPTATTKPEPTATATPVPVAPTATATPVPVVPTATVAPTTTPKPTTTPEPTAKPSNGPLPTFGPVEVPQNLPLTTYTEENIPEEFGSEKKLINWLKDRTMELHIKPVLNEYGWTLISEPELVDKMVIDETWDRYYYKIGLKKGKIKAEFVFVIFGELYVNILDGREYLFGYTFDMYKDEENIYSFTIKDYAWPKEGLSFFMK